MDRNASCTTSSATRARAAPSGRRARRRRRSGGRRRPRTRAASPRAHELHEVLVGERAQVRRIRVCSREPPLRISDRGAQVVEDACSASRADVAQRALGEVARRCCDCGAPLVALALGAQDDEADGRAGADDRGGGRARRAAQLRGSRIADSSHASSSSAASSTSSSQRRLQPRCEVARRLDRRERAAQAAPRCRSAVGSCSITSVPSRLPARCSSSCRMARCSSTLVAPSVRPSARAISRLSMPSAKRMISASRRSSGSCWTPARIRFSSSRSSPALGRVRRARSRPRRRSAVCGRRERSR